MLIGRLAAYLTWHLGPADLHRRNPARPRGSRHPGDGISRRQQQGGPQDHRRRHPREARSYQGLLDHLSELTRNQVRFTGTRP
ncbi:hypothetical protein ACNJ7E_14775 [Rhodococcus sp. NM-2]|uniref:hypothetical protein n=1 Tax=Rhodococcus sp. NM-2 TaxID=3401174 RepID=UPI003AAA75B7